MEISGSICDSASVCQKITLITTDAQMPDIDYSSLAQIWATGFSTVLGLWLVSYILGTIIRAVRNS